MMHWSTRQKRYFSTLLVSISDITKKGLFYMWSDCRFYPTNNINLLIQRSMIRIDDDSTFQMHDQLRDMGREIVRRENIGHPWKRSRIWTYETALELLVGKKGTNHVKAIRMVNSSSASEKDVELASECFAKLTELRCFEASDANFSGDFDNLLPNLRWLRLERWLRLNRGGSVADNLINFHMKNLVILELHGNGIVGDDWTQIEMANKLKVLDLNGCEKLTTLPKLPESGSLEVLDLGSVKGRIDEDELDIGKLRNLTVLNLEESSMKRIVGGTIGMMMEELRELNVCFCECENLGQVLVDVDKLQSLQILGAFSETNHQVLLTGKLPTSLKVLETSSPINNLSELIELEVLVVSKCTLEIPPADDDDNQWWKSSKLKSMSLYKVSKMWSTNPNNALLPSSLTYLQVMNCTELEWLPNLENLENLTGLVIEDGYMLSEIQGLGGLKALKTLEISGVWNLRQLDEGLHSLRCLSTLKLVWCDDALQNLPSLESLTQLKTLVIAHCPLLTEIVGIGGLASLQELNVNSAKSLIRIDGLGNLLSSSSSNKLKSIKIRGCPRLTSLSLFQYDDDGGNGGGRSGSRPRGGVVKSLENLVILGCTSLLLQDDGLQLPHLSKFPMLKDLTLTDVKVQVQKPTNVKQEEEELSALEGLDCLEELFHMGLGNLQSLERLPSLSKLGKLITLSITDIPRLREIEGIAGLKSLQHLRLIRCTSLERIDDLSGLGKLETINIQGCTKLERLPSVSNLGCCIL